MNASYRQRIALWKEEFAWLKEVFKCKGVKKLWTKIRRKASARPPFASRVLTKYRFNINDLFKDKFFEKVNFFSIFAENYGS